MSATDDTRACLLRATRKGRPELFVRESEGNRTEGVQRMIRWFRAAVVVGLGVALLAVSPVAGAPGWQPTKPVEFVVPAGTGGGADLMARFISAVLQKNNLASQNFLVVNKAGGAGAEAFLYVKFARGNPHVIVITLSSLFTTPMNTGIPFKYDQLTPLAMMALDYFILWVNADTPYKTAQEYMDAVRQKPGEFKMGGTGSAQEDQILTIQLEQAFGVKFTYLPLSGGGQVCANLVGKQVDSTVNNPSECVGHWKAGRVRPLAVLYNQRIDLPDWKDIPTMKDATGKDVSYLMLRGIFAPPGIPKEAEEYYINLLRSVTQSSDWQKYIDDNALKGQFMTGPPFVKWLGEANALHRDLMTKGGLLSPISKR